MSVPSSNYARIWRTAATVLCIAGCALVFAFPNDATMSLSVAVSRLLVVGGIFAATLLAWAVQYTFHVPMTRRALFPWGAVGGAGAELLFAAQSNSLGDHPTFVVIAVARPVLLCLTIRWMIDLVRGPLAGPMTWGTTTGEEPVAPGAVADEARAMLPDALRPAWIADADRAVTRDRTDLKLVSEAEARARNASGPTRHKRTSG